MGQTRFFWSSAAHGSEHFDKLPASIDAKTRADCTQDKSSPKIKMIPQPPSEPTANNSSHKNYNTLHIIYNSVGNNGILIIFKHDSPA